MYRFRAKRTSAAARCRVIPDNGGVCGRPEARVALENAPNAPFRTSARAGERNAFYLFAGMMPLSLAFGLCVRENIGSSVLKCAPVDQRRPVKSIFAIFS